LIKYAKYSCKDIKIMIAPEKNCLKDFYKKPRGNL